MRLLLINGNTTEFVTDTVAAEARRSCAADTTNKQASQANRRILNSSPMVVF